jgi:hypothetical protein
LSQYSTDAAAEYDSASATAADYETWTRNFAWDRNHSYPLLAPDEPIGDDRLVNDHLAGPSLRARYDDPLIPGQNDYLKNTLGFDSGGPAAIKAYPRVWDSCCRATAHQFNRHYVNDTQVCCAGATFGPSPPYERNDQCCMANETRWTDTVTRHRNETEYNRTDVNGTLPDVTTWTAYQAGEAIHDILDPLYPNGHALEGTAAPFEGHYAHFDSAQQVCCSAQFRDQLNGASFFTYRPSSRAEGFTYKNRIDQARCCGMGDYDHKEARCCDLENSRPAPFIPLADENATYVEVDVNQTKTTRYKTYDHWALKHKEEFYINDTA